MSFDNKTYDILKYIALTVLPALAVFVGVIGQSLNWQYTALAVTIITAVDTFIGSLLKVSTDSYNNVRKAHSFRSGMDSTVLIIV